MAPRRTPMSSACLCHSRLCRVEPVDREVCTVDLEKRLPSRHTLSFPATHLRANSGLPGFSSFSEANHDAGWPQQGGFSCLIKLRRFRWGAGKESVWVWSGICFRLLLYLVLSDLSSSAAPPTPSSTGRISTNPAISKTTKSVTFWSAQNRWSVQYLPSVFQPVP